MARCHGARWLGLENYQIAWMTFTAMAYRCRTSSLPEAVTAWRGTKSLRQ
jgi:hypothetical protein